MEWLGRMNKALEYIEDNLNGEMSLEKAAQIAALTQYQFQRVFSYMANMPLSVYLRQRRLTKAALDLQKGDKVIDVSLRYNYDSPTAFNRAFQAIHGITPSAAQKPDTVLKAFPRISFQIMIKGEKEMEYRIVKKEAFRIVGVRAPLSKDCDENYVFVPGFWSSTKESGVTSKMIEMINAEPMGMLGVMTGSIENGDRYYYIAVSTDKPTPEGMLEFTVPASEWAIFKGSGTPSSIKDLEKRIFTEWLPTSGYEWADSPDIEVFFDDNPTDMKYEFWIPLTKKA
jgi:AraC family transcriptional regulator